MSECLSLELGGTPQFLPVESVIDGGLSLHVSHYPSFRAQLLALLIGPLLHLSILFGKHSYLTIGEGRGCILACCHRTLSCAVDMVRMQMGFVGAFGPAFEAAYHLGSDRAVKPRTPGLGRDDIGLHFLDSFSWWYRVSGSDLQERSLTSERLRGTL